MQYSALKAPFSMCVNTVLTTLHARGSLVFSLQKLISSVRPHRGKAFRNFTAICNVSKRFTGASLLTLCLLWSQNLSAQGLPELSDTSALVMNAEQEKMFGQQVMLSVRAGSTFSDDILLVDYFSTLTANIATHSPREFGKTTTNLAIDPAINAFAVPGGYITINTGLIENTRSVDELASVIAHEIGHQSQRHISRSIERSKQLSLPAAAAMIGGILLGGQAGAAAVLTSQAAVGADRLAYSRLFEREADATGMKMLADAGYDPKAMPSFFSQLENQSRLYGGIMPEFLSTHPVSSDRIADGLSRAARLAAAQSIAITPANRLNFLYAQTRTKALYGKPLENIIKEFQLAGIDANQSPKARQIAQYGLSIAYMRNGDFKQAEDVLTPLLIDSPDQDLITLAFAQLKFESGDTLEAEKQYETLYLSDKKHPAFVHGYARALARNDRHPTAIRILRKTIRHQPDTLWAYELLAEDYAASGETMNALFIRAQMLKKLGLYTPALNLLHQAKRGDHPDASDYLIASISDLLKQTELAKKQLDNFKL